MSSPGLRSTVRWVLPKFAGIWAQLNKAKLMYFLLSLAMKCFASVYAESVSTPAAVLPAGVSTNHDCQTRWPLATVHSGDVTVHCDRPEWTAMPPECTVAIGQRGLTDVAGGHSGWQHCCWYTDWLSIHRRKALRRQTQQKIYQILPYLILPNPSEFWQNSPYNTANLWRQIGDEIHVIK